MLCKELYIAVMLMIFACWPLCLLRNLLITWLVFVCLIRTDTFRPPANYCVGILSPDMSQDDVLWSCGLLHIASVPQLGRKAWLDLSDESCAPGTLLTPWVLLMRDIKLGFGHKNSVPNKDWSFFKDRAELLWLWSLILSAQIPRPSNPAAFWHPRCVVEGRAKVSLLCRTKKLFILPFLDLPPFTWPQCQLLGARRK